MEARQEVEQSTLQISGLNPPPLINTTAGTGVQGANWWPVNDDATLDAGPGFDVQHLMGLQGLTDLWNPEENTWEWS